MKKVIYTGYVLVAIVSLYIIIGSIHIPFSYSATDEGLIEDEIVEEEVSKVNIIKQEGNVIYIDYAKLNTFLKDINSYINYSNELNKIYEDIIDEYHKAKKVKMYNEDGMKVLEISYTKDEIDDIYKKYINDYDNIIVKVLFNSEEELENIDIEAVNFKINREEVIRANIVKLAKTQIGNTGEEYWKWYGYNHRVEWCCVFVSWLAYKNGVLNTHIPKFVWVKKGVDYYRDKKQLMFPKEYTPRPGDVIFFNWNNNPVIDHVGIVEKVSNGYVYSIEGNVQYKWVKRRRLKLNSRFIYAYGVPNYSE